MSKTVVGMLAEAQVTCFNAHSDQIIELVNSYENYDDAIKMLIDERRKVYQEFSKRIDAAVKTE